MRRRGWWAVLVAGAVAVLGGLAWVTAEMLRLEAEGRRLVGDLEYETDVRLALWRMESWLAPRLAREAARPYYEYLPFFPQRRAYDSMFREIVPDEVRTPSPLLTARSELIRLHFQVTGDGALSSPQAPDGNALDVALSAGLTSLESVQAHRALLARLAEAIGDPALLGDAVAAGESRVRAVLAEEATATASAIDDPDPGRSWIGPKLGKIAPRELSKSEQARRQQQNFAQYDEPAPQQTIVLGEEGGIEIFGQEESAPAAVEIGPLVPVFLDETAMMCTADAAGSDRCLLLFARRVRAGGEQRLQGVVVDWATLRDRLLDQVNDLFPTAELRLLRDEAGLADPASAGRSLAQAPIALVVPPSPGVVAAGVSSVRATLVLVWIAVLVAVVAVGTTLRAVAATAERRSRFASSVTHELRTPLTTFRMYAEMLATGMVRDPARQSAYHETLRRESDRLAVLVENVLAYARLERGGALHPVTIDAGSMLEGLRPELERRVSEAGGTLAWSVAADAAESVLRTDVEAVGQVLRNLVDNACKYGRPNGTAPIELAAARTARGVAVAVRDLGPGIPRGRERAIFAPFERGGRGPADPAPGVGLGLALSRGLARRLGGDLVLDRATSPGARFVLELPVDRRGP